MIRREHVLSTLADMIADPSSGVPKSFYFDHGGEFSRDEIAEDLTRLPQPPSIHTGEQAARRGLIKARAYNAAAKGSIEGFFGQLSRRWLRLLPGWIGGDRMRKKTHQQGRDPVPYSKGWEAFLADFANIITAYHGTAQQKGHLAGRSPNHALRAAIEAGWAATVVARDGLEFAFSERLTRENRNGAVTIGNQLYRHDSFVGLGGSGVKVFLRRPLFGSRERIYITDASGQRLIGVADPAPTFRFNDLEGAREQARQRGAVARQHRLMRRQIDKPDLAQVVADYADSLPPRPEPNAPFQAIVNPATAAAAEAARLADQGEAEVKLDPSAAYWLEKAKRLRRSA